MPGCMAESSLPPVRRAVKRAQTVPAITFSLPKKGAAPLGAL
jgi:hypothetical protein